MKSFIHSFIQAISIAPLQVHYYSEVLPTQHGYGVGVHAEAPQVTASKGLAQGSYMAVRVGVEPTTLWTIGVDSTNEPPRPTFCVHRFFSSAFLCPLCIQLYNMYLFLQCALGVCFAFGCPACF